MASKKPVSSSRTSGQEAHEWHERHQRGELGGYGSYGGAQDQPPEQGDDSALAAQQPEVRRNQRSSDRTQAQDAEPYRAERVDGDAAENDLSRESVLPRFVGATSEMSEQFAGQDRHTEVTHQARDHGKALQAGTSEDGLAAHLLTLIGQAGLQARDVRISCQQGKVVVRGHVADAGTKAAITEVIRSAAGQASVDNGIEVRPERDTSVQGQGLASESDEYTVLNGRQV